MRRMRIQSGFTLIEVMIVVAIIGIIASIAIPNIQFYLARAKISEAVIAFTRCRTLITELYATGDMKSANDWGCEDTVGPVSKYVGTVRTLGNGTIVVTIDGTNDLRLNAHDITMAPLDGAGAVMSGSGNVRAWRCGSPIDGTDLDQRFLPGSCRGI